MNPHASGGGRLWGNQEAHTGVLTLALLDDGP